MENVEKQYLRNGKDDLNIFDKQHLQYKQVGLPTAQFTHINLSPRDHLHRNTSDVLDC